MERTFVYGWLTQLRSSVPHEAARMDFTGYCARCLGDSVTEQKEEKGGQVQSIKLTRLTREFKHGGDDGVRGKKEKSGGG